MPPTDDEIRIGPLTAAEWMTFFLIDDGDERNPLPVCCAAVSEVRNAILDVLRAGGDPQVCGHYLAQLWPTVEQHFGPGSGCNRPLPPALAKLHQTYVAGRPLLDDPEQALARIMAQHPSVVRQFLVEVPKVWDLDTVEGRIRAAARLGGGFVAFVLDRDERAVLLHELAKVVGMTYEDVALIVESFRAHHGLPWDPPPDIREPTVEDTDDGQGGGGQGDDGQGDGYGSPVVDRRTPTEREIDRRIAEQLRAS